MGLYGIGRAFNLKFRPQGPQKVYIYDKSMPILFGGRGPGIGYDSGYISQSVEYSYEPSFWEKVRDVLFAGTAALGLFGQVAGAVKDLKGAKKPKPQGATTSDADSLNKLKQLGDATGFKIVYQKPDGSYFAYNASTGNSVEGDFDYVQKGMIKRPDTEPKPQGPKKTTVESVEGPTPEPTEAPVNDNDYITPLPNKVTSYKYNIDVIDDGDPLDIMNKPTTISKEVVDSGYPKKLTINGNDYIFDTTKSKDGEVWYKAQFGKKQSYRLEELNEKIVLIQHEGDPGYNIANAK